MRAIRKTSHYAHSTVGVAAIQIGTLALLVAAWEVLVAHQVLDRFYYGQPSEVGRYFMSMLADGTLLSATWVTLLQTLAGFGLGMAVGTAVGLALWWSDVATALVRPLLVALNAVPKLIFAPLFMLAVGIGFEFKVLVSFSGVVIVALLAAYVGTQQADADQIDLVRSLGGTRWTIFKLIIVPTAVPWIIVSMEINIGLALIGAVVGEFLAADAGLGYLAIYGAGTFDMSLVLVAVSTLMILAALMYGAVRLFEHWALPWQPDALQGPR